MSSDNETEFKNKVFMFVASTLGIKQVFSSPYYPCINGHIENVHSFLKTCIQKLVSSELTWDEGTHIASPAYHFVPIKDSK